MTLALQRQTAASLLTRHRDLLDARPDLDLDGSDDDALAQRGWSTFLLDLPDAELARLEVGGVDVDWPTHTPPSLLAFITQVRSVGALSLLLHDGAPTLKARRHERPRKQAQVDAFAQLLSSLQVRTLRIVDVGSGHGHLTRALAAAIGRPVVGLERNAALAARAQSLAVGSDVFFDVTDVLRDGLRVQAGDCVVGLHACGELGDVVARSVAEHDVYASVAFVGCCLQKQRGPRRRPLCQGIDDDVEALSFPQPLLGLSNLTTRNDGVEATCADNLLGRAHRLTLRLLLARSGHNLRCGAELEGLNRRAAHDPLLALVARVYLQRGLPLPSAVDIEDAHHCALQLHGRQRRLALPRCLLGRVLEVFVLLDRGLFLQEHGFVVRVGLLFDAALSPRNLALVASR